MDHATIDCFYSFPMSYRLCMFWSLGQKMAEQVSNTQYYTGLEKLRIAIYFIENRAYPWLYGTVPFD